MHLLRLLLITALCVGSLSASAAPEQFAIPATATKFSVPKGGKVVFKHTETGIFRYTYIANLLIEEREPNGNLTQFRYKNKKLVQMRRLYKIGEHDARISRSNKKSGEKSTSEDKTIVLDGQYFIMGDACQMDEETGNAVICAGWDDPGDTGRGGGGGDDWGPLAPGDTVGGDTGGGGEVGGEGGGGAPVEGGGAEPLPGAAWWESPARAWCMHMAYVGFMRQDAVCRSNSDDSIRRACNENNWKLYNEYRDVCAAEHPK